jgi:energy-coupling factor transport system substrate-specific component
MKTVFSMWNNTRMIILTSVCAAIYSTTLLAFKTAIPLIPGITEVRVGNIFPVPFGLMFGPAGAWGSALGNLLGDIFGGTLGPGSVGGFIGNFLLAFLPYSLWRTLIPFHQKTIDWNPKKAGNWITYILVAFVSSAACAIVISTSLDFLGIVPYQVLSNIITLNNFIAGLIGSLLLTTVFPMIKNHLHLFWMEVMEESDSNRPWAAGLGAWLVALASLFGLFGGLISDLPVSSLSLISTLAILIGTLIL